MYYSRINKRYTEFFSLLILTFFTSMVVHSQTITLSSASPQSITINQGTTLTILQGDCDGTGDAETFVVQPRAGGAAITSPIPLNTGSAMYTFSDVGEFALICDCTGGLTTACGTAYNVNIVAPTTIPTLGEWGLIILGLILASVGLIVLRGSTNNSNKLAFEKK